MIIKAMNKLNHKITLAACLTLFTLTSCQKGGELPPIPNDSIRDSDDLNSGTDRDDPIDTVDPRLPTDPTNPDDPSDPTDPNDPTNPTPQNVKLDILPSDVNPDSVTLVYRKTIDPLQLGETSDPKDCHPSFPHKCVWNSQVIFGYSTEFLNNEYPKELWEITAIEMTVSFYTHALNKRSELFCLHNTKMCSGQLSKDDKANEEAKLIVKNPKFWTGKDGNHVANSLFTTVLGNHRIEKELWIVKDYTFNLAKLFKLTDLQLHTLFRKESIISFSVSDDTYVEDPLVKVYLKRRLPPVL